MIKVTTKEDLQKLLIVLARDYKANKKISIALNNINTVSIKDMSLLFSDKIFKDIDNDFFSGISMWNTAKVINMSFMFEDCINFNQKINFDTSNVTNMAGMFAGCKHFNQEVKINTSKVTKMFCMFENCTNFNQKINFDTNKVTNMSFMFENCINLEHKPILDKSSLKLSKNIFDGCQFLDKII